MTAAITHTKGQESVGEVRRRPPPRFPRQPVPCAADAPQEGMTAAAGGQHTGSPRKGRSCGRSAVSGTPLRSIRHYCVSCEGSAANVADCLDGTCALYPYRSGHRNKDAGRTPMASIRARCINCVEFSAARVRACECPDCELYHLCSGHRPRKGAL